MATLLSGSSTATSLLLALGISSLLTGLVSSQLDPLAYNYHFCINTTGNYTQQSLYQNNLNLVLANLSSAASSSAAFYNSTAGENSDRVYALFLCSAYVADHQVCSACIKQASQSLPQKCPNQKQAIIYYAGCMLRFADRPIFSAEENYWVYSESPNNVSNPDHFHQVLANAMDGLIAKTAFGSSVPNFTTGEAQVSALQKLYCLVQCTPDITGNGCNRCLRVAMNDVQKKFYGREWALIFKSSCLLRYDSIAPFYELNASQYPASPPLAPPNPETNTTISSNKKTKMLPIGIALIIAAVAVVTLLVVACVYFKGRKLSKTVEKEVDEIGAVETLQYDFDTIKAATDDFSDANKLGQGGFGPVYKGRLPNGHEIAVKRLSREHGQGEKEFKNEVMLVAKLQHRNLVRILGFCVERTERLLVYELIPNSSLDHFLFDPIKRALLDWESRYKIIGGVARGLLYLHQDSRLRIIHRDLKTSNILLDAEMNPKISDFGMARLSAMDETQGNTSRVVGTFGYMAPEYVMHGQFSVKSDIFSFGIILLEIVSGQKNNSFPCGEDVEDLLSYAWKSWREGTVSNLIDPILRDGGGSMHEVIRCIHIALLCSQDNVTDRPTMASVVFMLNNFSLTLPVPLEPAFFMQRRINTSTSEEAGLIKSSQLNNRSENYDSISELYPR